MHLMLGNHKNNPSRGQDITLVLTFSLLVFMEQHIISTGFENGVHQYTT
jgi:hypothetical protein